MRAAKVQDHWRRLRNERKGARLHKLIISDHASLEDGEIDLGGRRISALCGLNGAGKSRTVRILAGLMCSARDFLSDAEVGEDCSVELSLRESGGLEAVILDRNEVRSLGSYVEPHLDSPRLIHYFRSENNFDEVLQQFEFARWDSRQLDEASSITLRKYSWIEVAELDPIQPQGPGGPTAPFDPLVRSQVPFFRVKKGKAIYDSRGMGTGEFSALYLLWNLYFHKPEILLLEEPEAFLPPKSQIALMDIIARFLVESGASALITTHSKHVLTRLRLEEISVISNGSILSAGHRQLLESWGLREPVQPKTSTVIVEDSAAAVFTKCLFDKFCDTDTIDLDIRVGGSNGEIFAVLLALAGVSGERLVVGILDGDQRTVVREHGHSSILEAASCFLPGDSGPDSLLKEAAYANKNGFIEALEADSEDLALAALDGAESVEFHDWARDVASALSLTEEEVLVACFSAWCAIRSNRAAAVSFVNELQKALGNS